MPVKDTEAYLPDCLDSIRNQRFGDFELLAVDDGSTDRSRHILERAASEDPRVKWMPNEGVAVTDALRTAWKHSTGEWVHRMDSDDIMPPDKLERMMAEAEMGHVVTGKVRYFSDWMVGLGFQRYESWINDLMDSGQHWEEIYMECPLPSPAWVVHREDLERVGAFGSDLLPEDYDLCFRFYRQGYRIKSIPKVIHLWRDHQVRTTRKVPAYFPMAYYPLKLKYFLEIDRDRSKPLVLWGAGKKGKLLARLLSEAGEPFIWVTDNQRKLGLHIHDTLLQGVEAAGTPNAQRILAVASPEDKLEIQAQLDQWGLENAKDYWWFC